MEDLDPKSSNNNDANMQIESYNYVKDKQSTTPNGTKDLRCYSASYATSSSVENDIPQMQKEVKFKKGKSMNGSTSKSWNLNDPEMKRKRRVASYKVYTVEGKMKGSLRKSFRWIKHRCTQLINGWS
ncbi:hypothetical protein Leryth_010450 [Lithospermum erythrorhizon]|uniref:DUF3511 domain protein n=1 Tax=Lithospermum erythrorhizon TaxID=34254 RepID=A0AAV3PSJ0_LITER|nr:hypothetical protein Leryth_010450 [Lithospermum erythrorhizon]